MKLPKSDSVKVATVGAVIAVLAGITSVVGAWTYVDDRYAHRKWVEQTVAMSNKILQVQLIEIQIQIVEDRLDREVEKAEPRRDRIDRYTNNLDHLEARKLKLQE